MLKPAFFFALLVTAMSSFADWKLHPDIHYSWYYDSNYPILETGLEIETTSGGQIAWEYFVIDRPTGLCSGCRTIAILIEKPYDSRLKALSDQLHQAFRTGKKIRFMRNDSRNKETNVAWLDQTFDIYRIKPGDKVYLFLK